MPKQTYHEVSEFLNKNGLTNCYAPFWSSHVVTLASEDKVQVSHIIANGKNIEQHRWLSNSKWYQ